MTDKRADLVCEGGGVRGIGLVGAVDVLAEAGYSFPRVAGSSAGSIVAAFVAALQKAGEPLGRLHDIVDAIDYTKFPDRSPVGHVPLVGPMLSLFLSDGIYEGAYLESFVAGVLKDLGVRTFGDLRLGDGGATGDGLERKYAWALVITASDLSRRRLVRIPWDLPAYKKDPDEFPVAKAVRASAAIPFLFQPVRVSGATWVDGGLVDDFPIELFDRPNSAEPQWPTFGIRLSARPGLVPPTHAVKGPFSIALAALGTLLSNQDAAYLNDPCTVRRTVFVPSDAVSPIDFDITDAQVDALYESGSDAARKFLAAWDFGEYVAQCRHGFSG
ncbi:patatin-like phospholipase family protein [Tomitella fengzijianii]|uniref:Patatin-like phospholipase family protein n=1 Tax=Tomitella fengzijianii TaxID=2597660 RepID=A0A516X076_9ACTN|nr:patatin-like phospholipase family protein [Tomitella fengzijianii]QDQ96430.1 patatin-like phospholipase family protein [Tomitella fengzijianii]